MNRLPFFKFEPESWLTSESVLNMSLAGQGAYIRLLALQWVNPTCSIPDDKGAVWRQLGIRYVDNEDDINLDIVLENFPPHPELEGRRANVKLLELRREAEADVKRRSEAARAAGKQSSSIRQRLLNGCSTDALQPSTIEKEIEIEKKKRKTSSPPADLFEPSHRPRKVLEAAFDEWWALYPNKTERKKALELWLKIAPDEPLAKTIVAATRAYAVSKKVEEGFVKNPCRWLRSECWNDVPPPEPAPIIGGVQMIVESAEKTREFLIANGIIDVPASAHPQPNGTHA